MKSVFPSRRRYFFMNDITSDRILSEGQLFDDVIVNQTEAWKIWYLHISKRARASISSSEEKSFVCLTQNVLEVFVLKPSAEMKVPAHPELYSA